MQNQPIIQQYKQLQTHIQQPAHIPEQHIQYHTHIHNIQTQQRLYTHTHAINHTCTYMPTRTNAIIHT